MLVRLIGLAWRNLWRNPRRTWLTVSAIAFAVLFLVFGRSMQTGSFDTMIDNGARILLGHLQVQHVKYSADPRVDYTINAAPILEYFSSRAEIEYASARTQGFALVSMGERSFGAQIVGVEADIERHWSRIASMVSLGRYLQGRGEAVIGARLARNLGLQVGDELIILGTAKEGGIAASSVTLVGVFNTAQTQLDRSLVQIHIDDFREAWMLGNDEAHAVVVMASNVTRSEAEASLATTQLESVAVLAWLDLMPEAQQMRDMKAVSTQLIFYVIVIIVGFSVVTTFMMMVFERTQELGVLIAIGMKPGLLQVQLQLEALFLAMLGVVIGFIVALLLIVWLEETGIPLPVQADEIFARYNMGSRIYPSFDWPALQTSSVLMFVGVQLAALIPGLRIQRLRPVEAIRRQA